MKERSKQQQSSKQKIQTTIKSSEQRSGTQRARTVSTRILSVLDPRVQREAERVVVDRRPSVLRKKRLGLIMDRQPFRIRSAKELSDDQVEQLDKEINKLQGEQKREETIREKNSRDPEA